MRTSLPMSWSHLRGAFFTRLLVAVMTTYLSASALGQDDPNPEERVRPSYQGDHNDQTNPPKNDVTGGDPVVLSTGSLHVEETDLSIISRGMDLNFVRCYRSGTTVSSALGAKWDFNWNQFIVLEYALRNRGKSARVGGAGQVDDPPDDEGDLAAARRQLVVQGAFYYNGEQRIDAFTAEGTGGWKSPDGYFAKLRHAGGPLLQNIPTSFTMRSASGTIHTFEDRAFWDPFVQGTVYHLTKIEDRHGNTVRLEYENATYATHVYRRLTRVIDTLGRPLAFTYGTDNRLDSVTDFAGRTVTFERDFVGNLINVTGPEVLSHGAKGAAGRTTHYHYATLSDPIRKHHLLRIYAPQEWCTSATPVPYIENTYDTYSRVTRQVVGGTNESGVPAGGTYRFFYDKHFVAMPSVWFFERSRTLQVDPNGNASVHLFDNNGSERLAYSFAGRLNPDTIAEAAQVDSLAHVETEVPATSSSLTGSGVADKLHTTDPNSFWVKKNFNKDGLLEEEITPHSHTKYTYYTGPDVFQRGNLLKVERLPIPDGGEDPIVTYRAYEPFFNQLRAVVDPRGVDPEHTPPNGGSNSPGRYMTTYVFDYQEGSVTSGAMATLASTWGIDVEQTVQATLLSAAGIPVPSMTDSASSSLGDQNGDAVTTQHVGNMIVTRLPSPQVFVDPAASTPSWTSQTVETKTVFNSFSLPVSSKDPAGNVTTYSYNSESDPDGFAPPTVAIPGITLDTASGANGGGFLASISRPEGTGETFEYDALGRVTKNTNARGASTASVYNAADELVQVTDALTHVVKYSYDWNGNKVEEQIENKTQELVSGLPTGSEVYGPSGAWITNRWKYDLLSQVVEEDLQVDETTREVTRFRYDRDGNQVLVLLPRFTTSGPDHDAASVRATIFDERGLPWKRSRGGLPSSFSTLYANSAIPELASIASPATTSTIVYDYTVGGDLALETDGETHATTRLYDAFQRLERTTDPLNNYVTRQHDAAGNVVCVKERDATTVLAHARTSYDELGRIFQVDRELFSTDAGGLSTPDGPLTPGDGFVSTRTLFDANGHTTKTVDDNGVVQTYHRDGLGRIDRQDDALGNYELFGYDKASNLIRAESVEFDSTLSTSTSYLSYHFHDELNRLRVSVDNAGQASRLAYDSRGNVVSESDAMGASVSTSLDSLDAWNQHVASLSGPAVNSPGNNFAYVFDDRGRKLTSTRFLRPGGVGGSGLDTDQGGGDGLITTGRTYNANGELASEVDDNGHATTYEYDSLGRLKKTIFEDDTTETLTYDKNDRVLTRADANGTVTTNGYDAAGRLTTKSIAEAAGVIDSGNETMSYDGLGRMLSGTDGDSTLIRRYDSLGRVVKETLNDRITVTVYDGIGNLTSIRYPSERLVEHEFDGLNRLSHVRDSGVGSSIAHYRYAGARRVESRECEIQDTRLVFSHDDVKRITSTEHVRITAGTTIDARAYTWDRASNKTSRSNSVSGLTHEYTYSSAYELIASSRSGAGTTLQDISYELDGVGNRAQVIGGPLAGSYTLSASPYADYQMNQYTSTPATSNTFDLCGNLIVMQGTKNAEIAYDYRNQMVAYEDADTGEAHVYRYDVLGRRISKTVGIGGAEESTTQYFYNGIHVIEEQDDDDVTTATYVYGRAVDEVLSMHRGSQDYFFHGDDMGNVVAVTNASAVVVEAYEYRDYGEPLVESTLIPLAASSIGNPLLFTGARFDIETDLYHLRSRYLDPQVGRFTTRDSIGIWGDEKNRGNGYAYAGSNPWSKIDPTGMWLEDLVLGIPSIGMGIKSLVDNISEGNVGSAILDGIGIVADVGAVALPGVPGGAGMAIKAARGAVSVANKIDNVATVVQGALATGDAVANGDGAGTVVAGGLTALAAVTGVGSAKTADATVGVTKGTGKVDTGATVHGNSLESTKTQHRYEIFETETGDVVKTGISGEPLNKNGTSGRANEQVNKWNREEGEGKYEARVPEKEIPGRKKALDSEKEATNTLDAEGHSLRKQKRPCPEKK